MFQLDPTAGKEFMGYVVAANPLGQMLFSPLVGWWGNKRGSVRLPLLVTLAMFTLASAAYSILEVIPGDRKNYMLISRFFVGVSSGKFFTNFYIILTFIYLRYFVFQLIVKFQSDTFDFLQLILL